jgi:hypothetical protein
VINLVAKLPNPDGLEQFGPVWAEMQARKARLLSMKMIATNEEEGLDNITEDERVRGHLAMGGQGFGYVRAEGPSLQSGGKRIYDQREKVARRVVEEVGSTWPEATTAVLTVTRNSADVLNPVDVHLATQPEVELEGYAFGRASDDSELSSPSDTEFVIRNTTLDRARAERDEPTGGRGNAT